MRTWDQIRKRLRRKPSQAELDHARWEGRRDERARIHAELANMPRASKAAIYAILAAGVQADRPYARADFIEREGYDPDGDE